MNDLNKDAERDHFDIKLLIRDQKSNGNHKGNIFPFCSLSLSLSLSLFSLFHREPSCPSVGRLISRLVFGRSIGLFRTVCHNFIKGRDFNAPIGVLVP